MTRPLLKVILITLILNLTIKSYTQWFPQSSGSSYPLNSIFFINKNTGWICGLEAVLKTTDCGNNWTNNFLPGNFRAIYFTDQNTGWICGDNGKLYKTNNGGENWTPVNSGTLSNLNQINFLNQNTGLIAGNSRTILQTTNSGINWYSSVTSNSSLNFLSVKIINASNFIVTGTETTIYKTTDSGSIWDSLSFGMPNPLLTVDFINENKGWVSGCCGMFLKTTDGGASWSPEVYLTPGYSIYSMKFVDENLGWVAGDAGYILRTTNGGANWDSLVTNSQTSFHSIFFVNKDTGFVTGNNGIILRTTNGGGEGFPIGINQISTETPADFYLSQNYPNPFNPNTIINYGLRITSYVILKVFDLLGKEVATLVNEKQVAGNYNYQLSTFNYQLASGVYFYSLEVDGEKIDTKRMLMIK